MYYKSLALLFGLGMLVGPSITRGQDYSLRVDDAKWELSGGVERGETLGRPAIQIRTGGAVRRDVSLQDGTIEFDLAVTPHRSFVYLLFRMQDDSHYEEIYFRPHKSSLPDAIQYSPVFQGSNWQLYHGPGRTAAVELAPGRWIHVRLVLSGSRAALFVGDSKNPQMVIPLVRPPQPGYMAIRAFLAQGVAAQGPIAHYANLMVRPGHVPDDVRFDVEPIVSPPGIVRQWEVSQAFAPAEGPVLEAPTEILEGDWQELPTDESGLLVFYRHLKRLEGARRAGVLARVSIPSQEQRKVRINLGYSDEVTVFLNGERLFYADDSYSFDRPRRQGLIGLHQASLFLPLQPGRNELLLVIVDSFGGWGLIGQLEN